MTREFTIGEVARQAGVNVQTIRYYESRGMLAEPRRTSAGYRIYPPETVNRLRFIRRAQCLGFTLAEVEELLALRDRAAHHAVHAIAMARLEAVGQDLQRLAQTKEELQALLDACDRSDPNSSCSFLSALEEENDP